MKRFVFVLACLGATAPAFAGDLENGAKLFRENCATCHGLDADGSGPMAGAMVIKPKDLTKLSAENGGSFPLITVIKRIDGRDPLVSHGSPMPVYGYFWEGFDTVLKTEAGQPIMTSAPIADLVDYLKSLQG